MAANDTNGMLPLPSGADFAFWTGEVDRAGRENDKHKSEWDENVRWYAGQSPDAAKAVSDKTDFVNVNVDFYQVEQKKSQLFFDTPDLQLQTRGSLLLVAGATPPPPPPGSAPAGGAPALPGAPPAPPQAPPMMPQGPQLATPDQEASILHAHRHLLNLLLGPEFADVLQRAIYPSLDECLYVAGTGAVVIGYEPTIVTVKAPEQPGQMLGLQADIPVPIHEDWYVSPIAENRFLRPADFTSTDWDKAPWLGYRVRIPLTVAKRSKLVPADFTTTTTTDDYALPSQGSKEEGGLAYVEATVLWYKAAVYDESVAHPELFRELVLVDGLEAPARHRNSPHQRLDPRGRLTADSLIGNPIHPLTIRSLQGSSYVPSDSTMTRPLVRELCKFRTQMVQERDANKGVILYDVEKLTPETLEKITNGTVGTMVGVQAGMLAQGKDAIAVQITGPTSPRQTYAANDYITRDIAKTHAMDASMVGAKEDTTRSATEITAIHQTANIRLQHEQRQVLRWYLKLVDKFSSLVCRYMTPALAVPYIGQAEAATWGQWDKQQSAGRVVFAAKPDSQLKLDAAAERKFKLDIYQFTAKDPNANRVPQLKELFMSAGYDPAECVVEQLPQQPPQESIGFTFRGEDLLGPQRGIVLEILAAHGIHISPGAVEEASSQLYQQMALGIRDANGKAAPAAPRPAQHGGTAEQVRPLSQQSADQSGQRSGPPSGIQ